MAELIVAADLLARGWYPFFPIVRSTKIDLLVSSRDGKRVLRIEVRSGLRRGDRVVFSKKDNAECDHYGIVVAGEPVTYQPELPAES